jgi:hypothetical protein
MIPNVGERLPQHDAGVVDEKFDGEIVGTVDDEIVILIFDNIRDIGQIDPYCGT